MEIISGGEWQDNVYVGRGRREVIKLMEEEEIVGLASELKHITRESKKKLFTGDTQKYLETRQIHEKYVIVNNCLR